MPTHGFHEGELAVQRRAGVERDAARLAPMLAAPRLVGGLARFLADRSLVVLTARDHDHRLWTSPLFESPGFVRPADGSLTVRALPRPGDPLAGLPAGQPVGLVAIEFATRRRVRVNGTLVTVGADRLEIDVDQAFGNCPQYIQARRLRHSDTVGHPSGGARRWTALQPEHRQLIEGADTFFLGTAHPDRGLDASHRGGEPGFVRVDTDEVWWPDYPGNNMFNSLGNLQVDPEASLLFLDFRDGRTLHLSGAARIDWVPPGSPGDDGGTGRRVRCAVEAVVDGPTLDLSTQEVVASPANPPLR